MRLIFLCLTCFLIAGCSTVFQKKSAPVVANHKRACGADDAACLPFSLAGPETRRPMPRKAATVIGPSLVEGKSVTDVDGTSAAEKAKAKTEADKDGQELGLTIAALGDVAQQGFWLKTPLVKAEATGKVVWTDNGAGVSLTLLPLDAPVGSGSQLSLAAMRALEVPLTELPELRVFRLPQ